MLNKAGPIATFHRRRTVCVAFDRWFLGDLPIFDLGASNTQAGLEHILLADRERCDIDPTVLEVLEAAVFVSSFRFDRQAQQSCDSATDLGPS